MAGGVETPQVEQGRGQKKKVGPGVGVRIDMTPMVDVIMLLLTFFMLTTTLSAPQLMKISLPKGDVERDKVKVNMGNVLFVRVAESGNVYFARGKEDGSEAPMEKVDMKSIASRLEALFNQNKDLLLILKIDRKVKYNVMASLYDEILRAKIEKRYSFVPLDEKDREKIVAAGG